MELSCHRPTVNLLDQAVHTFPAPQGNVTHALLALPEKRDEVVLLHGCHSGDSWSRRRFSPVKPTIQLAEGSVLRALTWLRAPGEGGQAFLALALLDRILIYRVAPQLEEEAVRVAKVSLEVNVPCKLPTQLWALPSLEARRYHLLLLTTSQQLHYLHIHVNEVDHHFEAHLHPAMMEGILCGSIVQGGAGGGGAFQFVDREGRYGYYTTNYIYRKLSSSAHAAVVKMSSASILAGGGSGSISPSRCLLSPGGEKEKKEEEGVVEGKRITGKPRAIAGGRGCVAVISCGRDDEIVAGSAVSSSPLPIPHRGFKHILSGTSLLEALQVHPPPVPSSPFSAIHDRSIEDTAIEELSGSDSVLDRLMNLTSNSSIPSSSETFRPALISDSAHRLPLLRVEQIERPVHCDHFSTFLSTTIASPRKGSSASPLRHREKTQLVLEEIDADVFAVSEVGEGVVLAAASSTSCEVVVYYYSSSDGEGGGGGPVDRFQCLFRYPLRLQVGID